MGGFGFSSCGWLTVAVRFLLEAYQVLAPLTKQDGTYGAWTPAFAKGLRLGKRITHLASGCLRHGLGFRARNSSGATRQSERMASSQ